MRRALAWLAFVFAVAAPAAAQAGEGVYGIVIGNNEPPASPAGDGLHTLRFADDDAIRYTEFLKQFSDNVRLHTVLDAQTRKRWGSLRTAGTPTLAGLRRSLKVLSNAATIRRDAGDRITFYLVFSAHGAIGDDGEAFVSLLDGELSRAVLFDEILAQIPADRVHLIIDACHAAGVVGLRGKRSFGKEVEGQSEDVTTDEAKRWVSARTLNRFPHVGVLAATTAGEQAHEWSAIESGVFSHEVLSALWGAGDINGDLRVEYSEIQAFVAAANRRVDDPKAVPKVVSRPPPDDPHDPVSNLSQFRESVTVVGDASALGHFHIDRHNGQRHLDANLGSNLVTVAVPAGSSAFLRAGGKEVELPHVAGQRLDLDGAPRRKTEVESRGSTGATYRRSLFREPYTPDYYRGYVDSIGGAPVVFTKRKRRPKPSDKPPPPRVIVPTAAPPTVDRPRRTRDPVRSRRGGGIAFAVLAGGTGIAALVTGGMAGRLRAEFDATEVEADAHGFAERHRPLATAAIATGVISAASIIAAALLIRSARKLERQKAKR